MTTALKLLIVDDCVDDCLLLVRRVRQAGYQVRHLCIDTAEAMAEALRDQSWDAIVSDVSMPNFSAAAALRLYQLSGGTCPFLVVSGVIGEETAASLLKAGAHDFLLKDNLARLVPALEREMRESETRRARIAAEEALRRSEERYALAARGANDGLWDWDVVAGRVYYSTRWREMIGCSDDTIEPSLGGWLNRVHPDDLPAVENALSRILSGSDEHLSVEHRIRHCGGGWRWALVRGLAVYGPGGPLRLVGSLTDTTAYREAVEEMRRARDLAQQALAAKTRFLAAASHDLRQPVQALLCFSGVLQSLLGGHPAAAAVADLDSTLGVLKSLLDSLLDVSRLDAGQVTVTFSDVAVGEILDQVGRELAGRAADKGLRFRVVPCRHHVRTDPVLLSRMLRNLLENALKYTEAGGVLIGCRHHGDSLTIVVADTGAGISPEHLGEVFEEFFQVGNSERDRRQGLGLGLAIVRRLSHLLRHPVTVRSVVGRGSAFAVTVPVVEPVPAVDAGVGRS
ncbi:MAG: PAS domain-containing protein [Magnetospirillum sp.]|nr:PAS domain-containing protein [Magnetospirillum sp.]